MLFIRWLLQKSKVQYSKSSLADLITCAVMSNAGSMYEVSVNSTLTCISKQFLLHYLTQSNLLQQAQLWKCAWVQWCASFSSHRRPEAFPCQRPDLQFPGIPLLLRLLLQWVSVLSFSSRHHFSYDSTRCCLKVKAVKEILDHSTPALKEMFIHKMWPWATKAVLSCWGIFLAITKNTLHGSKLSIFLLQKK